MTRVAVEDRAETAHVLSELQRVMGTVITFDLVVPPGSDRQAHLALARTRAFLRRADAVFSLWKPDSPMSQVRRGELALDDAPAEVAGIVELCERARHMTDGWFDASSLPGGFDPTGVVKGWATQQASDILAGAGFNHALVNAGGDVMATGGRSATEPWRVGILDPSTRTRLLGVVNLTGSLATSGSYERGEHLFDPTVGRFASRLASASVIGPDLAIADAFATALAVAGEDGLSFISAAEGYEALALSWDGSITTTPGFVLSPSVPVGLSA